MRRYVLVLVIGVGVMAIVLGTFVAFFLHRPDISSPEIRFFTLKDTYRLGEDVVFRLDNNHTLHFCTHQIPWTITRQIDGQWQRVESHLSFDALTSVAPGESAQWRWKAETYPLWGEYGLADFGLAEVTPGEYRIRVSGWLCPSLDELSFESGGLVLSAFFTIEA